MEGLCPKPTRRRPHLDTSIKQQLQNKPISAKAEEAIINTLIAIKADGIREATCRQINYKLKDLARNTDIFNPTKVKQHISIATNQITGEPLSQATRNKFAYVYSKFCKVHQIFWKRPYYKVDEKTRAFHALCVRTPNFLVYF